MAYGVIKVNNPDGTIRYGTYEVPLYAGKDVNIANPDQKALMISKVKITINQPRNAGP